MTNWQGEPLCVVETTAVATVPFEEVSEEFAATEGEGDRSLRYWREVHWAYFGRVCKRIRRVPSPRMPIVCERFEVIYRGAPPERAALPLHRAGNQRRGTRPFDQAVGH